MNPVVRKHWAIENKLDWGLDVGFGEDACRKRAGHTAQNFSVLTRIALNLLKQDKSCKLGVHGKRLQAAWDHDLLLRLPGVQILDAFALPNEPIHGPGKDVISY